MVHVRVVYRPGEPGHNGGHGVGRDLVAPANVLEPVLADHGHRVVVLRYAVGLVEGSVGIVYRVTR